MLHAQRATCVFRPVIGWKSSEAIARASTAFALTSNGVFVLGGQQARRRRLSFVTTIDEVISTPGEILREEFLEPMGISQYRLAKAIGKPQSAISDIVHGKRSITPEMAWLFGAALGTTPQFWLNLEASYQLKMLEYKGMPEVVALA
ncbi:MAG: HigA family addiction module antidote protein [Collinsella stercoris]|jgi:addiction module antidote protein HigA|nr:HigA family addiction module antidote protein [Collinsella stercoris]